MPKITILKSVRTPEKQQRLLQNLAKLFADSGLPKEKYVSHCLDQGFTSQQIDEAIAKVIQDGHVTEHEIDKP